MGKLGPGGVGTGALEGGKSPAGCCDRDFWRPARVGARIKTPTAKVDATIRRAKKKSASGFHRDTVFLGGLPESPGETMYVYISERTTA